MNRSEFFESMKKMGLALTFDDVKLGTGHCRVLPDSVSLETRFSRRVSMRIPILSSAMDTVTEDRMAIELAKLGGIGVLHRNMTPKEQAKMVARVKYHLHGKIDNPIFVYEDETIEEILRRREKKGYSFHTFPVLSRDGKLVGMLTESDFEFCKIQNPKSFARDVMSRDPITADSNASLDGAFGLMLRHKIKAIPLVDEKKKLTGLYVFSDVARIKSGSSATYNLDEKARLRVAAAIGVGADTFERIELLRSENVDAVVIDTAHADSENVASRLSEIKKQYPDIEVVAGNVSEADSVERLIRSGADAIKVGQGPGSICISGVIDGTGCPQLTAIYECAQAARRMSTNIPVIADGGMRYSGDIVKALAAGADCVMLGKMLAGTEEAPGKVVYIRDGQFKDYRGMGSLDAMERYSSSRERYGQSDSGKDKIVPEGVVGVVPYKGSLRDVMVQYLGGIRRGMGRIGAAHIKEIQENARFWRVTPAGKNEAHPHDIQIVKQAPNYPDAQREDF